MNLTGRKPFDPVLVARALFKIGLGLVARDAGRTQALGEKFNAAREFIRVEASFSGYLMLANTGEPHPAISTWWVPDAEITPVQLDFFGLNVAFHLQPIEKRPLVDPTSAGMSFFWLGGESGFTSST